MISGFRRDVDEICDLLGYYAALNVSSAPTFRDNLSVPSSRLLDFLTLEDGTDFENFIPKTYDNQLLKRDSTACISGTRKRNVSDCSPKEEVQHVGQIVSAFLRS